MGTHNIPAIVFQFEPLKFYCIWISDQTARSVDQEEAAHQVLLNLPIQLYCLAVQMLSSASIRASFQ